MYRKNLKLLTYLTKPLFHIIYFNKKMKAHILTSLYHHAIVSVLENVILYLKRVIKRIILRRGNTLRKRV